ncbi:MAG: hypothetical protein GY860_26795 [Desulfobacteraceae bacterium]|nr:hypothetical protein [Desulfobacteraceae bacterium]
MLNSIKKYLQKAKEEVSKEYSIGSSKSEQTEAGKTPSTDSSLPPLPKTWIGVDLDGTLAYYDNSSSIEEVGTPIPAILALVKKMINNGIRVKIFTARATDPEQLPIIRKWLKINNLPELEITNIKDYYMLKLYDDRCIQVEKNTGRLITGK